MKVIFTFNEVCGLLNALVEEQFVDSFAPLPNGLVFRLHYESQWKKIPIRLAMKIRFRFHRYAEGVLSFSLEMNNFLLDLFKKILVLIIQKFFWKKFQKAPDVADILPYIVISPNRFSIDLAGLMRLQDVPVEILHIENEALRQLSIEFRLLPEKLKETIHDKEDDE